MTYLGLDISEEELEENLDIFDRGVKKDLYMQKDLTDILKKRLINTPNLAVDIEDQTSQLEVEDIKETEVTEIIIKKLITFGYSDGLDPEEKKYIIELSKHVPLSEAELDTLFYSEQIEISLTSYRERVIYIVLAINLATKDGIITKQEKTRILDEAKLLGFSDEMLIVIGELIDKMTTIQAQKTAIEFYATELEAKNIELEAKNTEIAQQSEEIKTQAESLQKKNDLLEEQKKHILASIDYAKLIQKAFLPHPDVMEKIPEHFVLYKPKDIVSGDYYWVKEQKKRRVITAADSTGHGVPGGFMSVLGSAGLHHIMTEPESETFSPGTILNKLRDYVKSSLDQEKTESKDGMDMALITLDKERKYLEYAGAYNPLYIIRNGELHETKATKSPVGIHISERDFETTRVDLEKGDMIYMFSDGYVDQFGGPNGKKLKSIKFKEILLMIADKPEREQKTILEKVMKEWMDMGVRKEEQIDDIIVMGIRV